MDAYKNRLLIFFFYDKDGVVDEYVPFFLENMRKYCSKIVVVVNGYINDEGEALLSAIVDKVVCRENTGLDVYAYRHIICDYIGIDKIKDFDEVLLTNFTIFGPIFSLDKLFETMDKRDCDFWGLTSHPIKAQQGKVQYHIQSYFINYKKKLITSKAFDEYWTQVPEIETYADSVHKHELKQTPFFNERGFVSDSYVPYDKYEYIMPTNSIISACERQLIEDECPFIKRRIFYYNNEIKSTEVDLHKLKYIVDYIRNNTNFCVDFISTNIRRTQVIYKQIKKASRKRIFLSKYHPSKRKRAYYYEKVNKNPVSEVNCYDLLFDVENEHDYNPISIPEVYNAGRHSYAGVNTVFHNKYSVLGAFCSIGNNCVIGHGEHPVDFLSTSPYFYYEELGFKAEDVKSFPNYWFLKPVIIGNDVWIGDGVFIKNGLHIGDGAIIGARSVVTKDVPPYAIVVGNPAKIIKYRFSQDIVQKLVTSKWWDLSDEQIKKLNYYNINQCLNELENLTKR